MGGQGASPGGGELSIDTQTGFGGDTGQQEMGWTGSAADTASTHGPSETPTHSAPSPSAPAYSAPRRADEAPARLPETPAVEHAPATLAPDHRPHVVWSSAPSTADERGPEGPARDE